MISRFFIEFYRVLRWKIVFRPLVFWAKVVVQTKFHCMQWVRPFSPLNKYWNKKKETSYNNLSSLSGVVATVTIAFIMVGDINSLAPIVTMPFLLTYACIDYSYFALAQTFDIQTKREERFRIRHMKVDDMVLLNMRMIMIWIICSRNEHVISLE